MLEAMLGSKGKPLKVFPDSGPGTKVLLFGDEQLGYFGEVPEAQMVSALAYRNHLGLTAGWGGPADQYWFKFYYKNKIIYITKNYIRGDVSWNNVYAAGGVYGTNDNGLFPAATPVNQYKPYYLPEGERVWKLIPRLLQGSPTDPVVGTSAVDAPCEWNDLMYRVCINSPAHAGEWAKYTAVQLSTNATLAKETSAGNSGQLIGRGGFSGTDIANAFGDWKTQPKTWRGVFELSVNGTVETLPPMPILAARLDHVVAVVGNVLYAGAGRDSSNNYLQDFYKCDLITRQWTALPNMPAICNGLLLVAVGTKLYYWGRSSAVSVFDTVTETWTTSPAPNGTWYIYGGTGGYYNGKLYVLGCDNGQALSDKAVLIYDIATGTYSQGASSPTRLVYTGGAMIGSRLYYVGGALSTDSKLRWYDANTDTHGVGPDTGLPGGTNYWIRGTSIGGKLYLVGGANGSSLVLDKVLEYDPTTDKITELKKLPSPRCLVGLVGYQDKLLILGGSTMVAHAPTSNFISYTV